MIGHPSPAARRFAALLRAFAALALAASARAADAPPAAHVPPAYTLRHWQEREGFNPADLVGVRQDAPGFLWVVSKTGLGRFDGTTFEPVAVPVGAFPRGFATVPAGADDAGTLVLPGNRTESSADAGCFVWRGGAFAFDAEPALAGKAPRAAFYAPDGARWIGCEDGTLLRRLGASVTRYELPAAAGNNRPPVFASDGGGRVWIAWASTVHRIEGEHCLEVKLTARETDLRLVSSRTGGVWLINRTSLWRALPDGGSFAEVRPLPAELVAHFVQVAIEDQNGFLWLGTRSQGLFRWIGGETLRVPTSSDDIAGLCDDADGSLWVATDGGGLNRLRPQAHQLFDRDRGLFDNYSYTVCTDATGVAWLANRDGGVARVQDGAVDPIARRANWRQFSARSVHPAPDGGVWITSGLGVFRTTAAQPDNVERIDALNNLRNIRATFVARNGDYWLAVDPDRVARWRDGALTYFDAARGFDGREVRAFAEDARGRIWLGAANGQLFRSTDQDAFTRVAFPGAADCGALQAIHFEPDGRMLVGTTRRGVAILAGRDYADARYLERDQGLGNTNVSAILVDDHDRYWFATRAGIYWAPGAQLRAFADGRANFVHTIPLGADDGVPPLSCLGLYQPAAWKADDGTLWFATRRGVLRTDPAIVARGRDSVPNVSVARVTFDDRDQPVAPEIELPAATRKTAVRLSALNLATPESTQLRVRLEGFDADWTVLGADRTATFPRLPPGRYVLAATVSNGGGPWHVQPPLLTLVVHPPWWREPWIEFATSLALLGSIWAATRAWSHRRLKLRLRAAEHARAIERERTRIARDIHDDIGATLTRISLLTQAAQRDTGPHAATFDKIYESTRSVTRALNEIVWAVNPRHDNLESFIYYLSHFAQELLGAAGLRCRLESPNPPPPLALESRLRHALFLGCREALHNVVKHAAATEVTIAIAAAPGQLTVTIADNGRGLAPRTDAPAIVSPLASGNGLGNMQQHMTDVGGRCTIEPGANGGTVVTFHVPLPTPLHADENPTRAH
ncbi:MAG: hypothetical protein HYV96_05085 [Opitutae bacterium]|nr:hypothetical protein [Opitutae bacterium]